MLIKKSVSFFLNCYSYGVKSIEIRGDKILILLTYTPKKSTLVRKFGNLPVDYVRTKLETEEELKIYDMALRQFEFNKDDDDDDDDLPLELKELQTMKRKRICMKETSSTPVQSPQAPLSPDEAIDMSDDEGDTMRHAKKKFKKDNFAFESQVF